MERNKNKLTCPIFCKKYMTQKKEEKPNQTKPNHFFFADGHVFLSLENVPSLYSLTAIILLRGLRMPSFVSR